MPLALPPWLMPSLPADKPRKRDAQHLRQDAHAAANKRKVGTDSDAHTNPARKHKLGGNMAAHTGPVKKQKLVGNVQAYLDTAVQGLTVASAVDDNSGLQTSDAKDCVVQTEQDLTCFLPTQAPAFVGTVAASILSSWQQPLFSELDRAQHNGRGPVKKAGKQAESGRPQKRVQMYENIRASQRCGYCKTCLNRSMKKACLTRRAEVDVAKKVVA